MESENISEKLYAMASENELLKESYASMAAAVLAFDDKGWNDVSVAAGTAGFVLQELKDAAARIREMSEGNPLLKRGSALRSSYVFGKGVSFGILPSRFQKFVDDQKNQDVLFSTEAQTINERSHFTDGQFFVLGDITTKTFQRIPFSEISAVVTNPDNPEELWYYRRSWTRKAQDLGGTNSRDEEINVWYPADTYVPLNGRYVSKIGDYSVNVKFRMFASRVNRRAGTIWGVPDAMPAVPWAHAYNEFLKDGSRMLKALSMFAWQLKSKTKAGVTNAAAAIATPGASGSTAVLGSDMELSSMPRAGSIDLTDGRPLGSMVASALEVSVVALLSDPGTSGAYGTAQTLDVPTLKAMEARQAIWTNFYRRILFFMGIKEPYINWPKIESEPSQRLMQALALARETNAIWDDEYRDAVIETLDIPKLHENVPPPPGDEPNGGSPIPSQGNSGAVGSTQDNAQDLAQADAEPTA
jgi:hypothetical protein